MIDSKVSIHAVDTISVLLWPIHMAKCPPVVLGPKLLMFGVWGPIYIQSKSKYTHIYPGRSEPRAAPAGPGTRPGYILIWI